MPIAATEDPIAEKKKGIFERNGSGGVDLGGVLKEKNVGEEMNSFVLQTKTHQNPHPTKQDPTRFPHQISQYFPNIIYFHKIKNPFFLIIR